MKLFVNCQFSLQLQTHPDSKNFNRDVVVISFLGQFGRKYHCITTVLRSTSHQLSVTTSDCLIAGLAVQIAASFTCSDEVRATPTWPLLSRLAGNDYDDEENRKEASASAAADAEAAEAADCWPMASFGAVLLFDDLTTLVVI